ncbi:hypothetical protein ASD24_09775 [Paenibacillus sp. Root52]|uniref:Uncharacterized protein n=1 Tax=Paenibacillus amylolyticus TaxID=1451 RepID=A0AAP5H6Z7_PAEAM|nr:MULTISPECIES: hypothetical protein [Paenibacillus]KQY84071.1 hypothetical protein ASD24_09775 [Paenibacillus sp. Root52]MDR6726992.1 hypothetical protein [Paenibacillus amylolyticus]
MFIIVASKGMRSWISGIFDNETTAEQYIDTIPDELKEFQQRIVINNLNYPFYIVERDGFQFLTEDEVIAVLEQTEVTEDEDEVHFNLYTIESDYQPRMPGTDYMGILRHEHVTNEFVQWYKSQGIDFLHQRGILCSK